MKDSDWEILYELHKTPNMTKVANSLYMTQPSLTKRLQHMEEEFGVAIVNRTPKGLKFTVEGEYLAQRAKLQMEFMKETMETLKEMEESKKTIIRIGSCYTYSKYTLAEIMVPYKQLHPEVQFDVVMGPSQQLFRDLLEDKVDVAFVRGDYEGKVNQTLIENNVAYLVTKEPIDDLEKLQDMQMISYRTNDKTRELLEEWWKDRFAQDLPAGMEAGYVDFTWQLISKGLGYTICFLVDNFTNEYNLCLKPLLKKDGSKLIRNTWFMTQQSKRLPKEIVEFSDFVEKQLVKK